MQKAPAVDDATLDAHANTPTIMTGPDQTNLARHPQAPAGKDNASNQHMASTRNTQHSILEGGIATRTHNHLPSSSNVTRNNGKVNRMNDTDTPQGPEATLGIDPPIGKGVANGSAADVVTGTHDKSIAANKKNAHAC
jgi:hypothetical protein